MFVRIGYNLYKDRIFILFGADKWGVNAHKKTPQAVACSVSSGCLAEREALELILSQNIIKLQTTDNQV